MSIITNEMLDVIENLKTGKDNARSYAEIVQFHERNIVSLQIELKDITDFMNGELFILASDTIRILVTEKAIKVRKQIATNEMNKTSYFEWVEEYIEKYS